MELSAAFLCDYASVRESLLFITAGGVTRIWREPLPTRMGVWLALLIQVDRLEADVPHEMRIVVVGEDGNNLAEVKAGFQVQDRGDASVHESVAVPIVLNLSGVPIEKYGSHSVEILIDGTTHRSLQFEVRPPAQKHQEQQPPTLPSDPTSNT